MGRSRKRKDAGLKSLLATVLLINVVLFVFLNRVPGRMGETMIKIAFGNIILLFEAPQCPEQST